MPIYLGQLYSPIVWLILLGMSSTLVDGCVRHLAALGNSMILSVNKYSSMGFRWCILCICTYKITACGKYNCSTLSLQDAIDLFLGNYTVDRFEGTSVPSPLHVDQPWKFKVVGVAVLVTSCLLCPPSCH